MNLFKNIIKRTLKTGFWVLVVILLCNVWVVFSTNSTNFYDLTNLPPNEYGLVLGTSKYLKNGKENLFYTYRMDAAARLYHEGKVKFLILSGNHDAMYYNEPEQMRKSLIDLGVPTEVMKGDFAGFRTYDSILHCQNLFKCHEVTIISQPFHNARALFIANQMDMNAVAFAAQDVTYSYGLKTYLREYLARPRAILDVWVLDRFSDN